MEKFSHWAYLRKRALGQRVLVSKSDKIRDFNSKWRLLGTRLPVNSALSRVKTDSQSLHGLTRPRCWILAAFWLPHLPQREVGGQKQRPVRWYSSCVLKVLDSNTGGGWCWLNQGVAPSWNVRFETVSFSWKVILAWSHQERRASGALQRSVCPQIYWASPLTEAITSELLVACSSLGRKYVQRVRKSESQVTLSIFLLGQS